MSNNIRRMFKKQTLDERVKQIGRVQTEMWIVLSKVTKELGEIQNALGITPVDDKKEDNETTETTDNSDQTSQNM